MQIDNTKFFTAQPEADMKAREEGAESAERVRLFVIL